MTKFSKQLDQQSYYFIYYFKTEKLVLVSKKAFKAVHGACISYGARLVKVVGCQSRSHVHEKIRKALATRVMPKFYAQCMLNKRLQNFGSFKAQSLLGDTKNLFTGAKIILQLAQMVGNMSQFMETKGKSILISIVKLFMEIYTLMTSEFSFVNFCQIILSIYQLHDHLFSAQSLDVFLIAGISAMLPDKIVKILRSAQLLTQMKIGDDLSLVNKLISAVFNLCDFLMGKVPDKMPFKDHIMSLFDFFKNNTAHVWIMQMDKILDDTDHNSSKVANSSYRRQIEALNKKITSRPEIMDWCRRSAALANTLVRWKNLMRIVNSYNQPDRQEPNCFVFEGKPGCMKSLIMNAVITASGLPNYSHMVKASTDGKDWYDQYNNEDIFFMDDVGQQGVSQWRTIINMVSSVKLPLECADAVLKDTKFFNSKTIMLTTNCFQHLQGITKQDCIADVTALWRRGYVFDFANVGRKGEFIIGKINFTYYDINTGRFEQKFPADFVAKYPDIPSSFTISDTDVAGSKLQLIAWVLSVVMGFSALKQGFVNNNRVTSEDAAEIKKIVEAQLNEKVFNAQGFGVSINQGKITNETMSARTALLRKAGCDSTKLNLDKIHIKKTDLSNSTNNKFSYLDLDPGFSTRDYSIPCRTRELDSYVNRAPPPKLEVGESESEEEETPSVQTSWRDWIPDVGRPFRSIKSRWAAKPEEKVNDPPLYSKTSKSDRTDLVYVRDSFSDEEEDESSWKDYLPDVGKKIRRGRRKWNDKVEIDEDDRPNGTRFGKVAHNMDIYGSSNDKSQRFQQYNQNVTVDEDIALHARDLVRVEFDDEEEELTWGDKLAMAFWRTKYFVQIIKYTVKRFIKKLLYDPDPLWSQRRQDAAAITTFLLVLGIELLIIHMIKWAKKKYWPQEPAVDPAEVVDVAEKFTAQSWRVDFKWPDSKVSSSVVAMQRAVKEVDLIYDGVRIKGFGVVSGRHILVPYHFVQNTQGVIVIYKNRDLNHICVDNEKVETEWSSPTEDLAILALPKSFPSPFPNMSHFFQDKGLTGVNTLVNSFGYKHLCTGTTASLDRTHTYSHKLAKSSFINEIGPKDFTYEVQGLGLCGSLVVNSTGGVLGMHVAGSPMDGTGVALKWSSMTRKVIENALIADKNILPWQESEKILPGMSVVKLDRKMNCSVPSYTDFGPSPLFGIYNPTRSPANLRIYGPHTVKDIAKKSFSPVSYIPEDEVKFATMVIESIIHDFDEISESEIVKGNSVLAPLNKKSSNGFACEKEKDVYVDFEEGVLTEKCRKELEEIEQSILNDNPKWDAFVWVESLKDEIRNDEKNGVPRSFRIGTIHQQILMKKYFGSMVGDIITTRDFHQIMVGMNPFKEWPGMHETLIQCLLVFAGDIKTWDGEMKSQAQRAVCEVIEKRSKSDKKIVSFLLETLVHSLVAIQDDFVMTTHSFPSGSFLTAIFNSLINKFYTAMWFYRECVKNGVSPSVKLFWEVVIDYVYGDDKCNGVRKYPEFLNAITMRDFFVSMGMDFTTATKQKIVSPSESMDDIQFLKRNFRYHSKLGRVVCPLELRTLQSGLSFVNSNKDLAVVMDGKLGCFQRELFLHPDGDMLLYDFHNRMKGYNWKYKILPESYMMSIYEDENVELDGYMSYYL